MPARVHGVHVTVEASAEHLEGRSGEMGRAATGSDSELEVHAMPGTTVSKQSLMCRDTFEARVVSGSPCSDGNLRPQSPYLQESLTGNAEVSRCKVFGRGRNQ